MPKDTPRTLGTSPGEVLINSGGEQFFLYTTSDSPATISLTFAQLPDGSSFNGYVSYAGSPAFTTSSTNYVWFRLSSSVLENNDTGFLADIDTIPLWQFDVDGSGVISNIYDRRPWFGGSGGVGNVETGLIENSTGTDIYNTNLTACRFSAFNFAFQWDSDNDTLSWDVYDGNYPSDDLQIEVTDPDTDTVINTITSGGSISSVTAGAYVYFDVNRAGGSISLSSSSGPPTSQQDRFILGKRVSGTGSANDIFVLFSDVIVNDISDFPGSKTRFPINTGGVITLEGKTVAPIEPQDSHLINGTIDLSGEGTSFTKLDTFQIDLQTYGIVRPSNATHALVKMGLKGVWEQTGSSTNNSETVAFVGPYTATPDTDIGAGSANALRFVASHVGGNSTTTDGANENDNGARIVELGLVSDPYDFTVHLNSAGDINDSGVATDLLYSVSIDAFYLDDSGNLPDVMNLEGLTFVPITDPADRLLEDDNNSYSSGPGSTNTTYDINFASSGITVPYNAKYAIIRGFLNANYTTSGSDAFTMYAAAWAADPITTPDIRQAYNQVCHIDGNNGDNTMDSGTVICPLNDPFLANDVSVVVTNSWASGTTDLNTKIWVEGFYIDDSGTAPSPAPNIGFSARKSTSQQITSGTFAGGGVVITGWDTSDFNYGSGFNETTGVFTAPEDGKYLITSSLGWNGFALAGAVQYGMFLYKNGSIYYKWIGVNPSGGANDPTTTLNAVVPLAMGDAIKIHAGQDVDAGGGAGEPNVGDSVSAADESTFFQAMKISE